MARNKRKKADGEGLSMDAEARLKLAAWMQQQAFTDPATETIINKMARQLGMGEVVSHIAKLRAYAKRSQATAEPKE